MNIRHALLGLAAGLLLATSQASAQEKSIVVASTTSTQDSGLFGHILPMFKAKSGIDVKVVAQGTGQALDTARRGDADVVFVHAKSQEEKFVADGFGVKRFDVMYNDFVVIGPKADPAKIKGGKDVVAALKAISASASTFVSRGDKSGTHAAELALWKAASLDPATAKPAWYREIGQGMGAALNMAGATNAYVLSDRGTWISFKNKGDLEIVVEGDQRLFNQYGIMLVNPEKHPTVKKDLGQAFVDWVVSAEGQEAIRSYKIEGQQLFFPRLSPARGVGTTHEMPAMRAFVALAFLLAATAADARMVTDSAGRKVDVPDKVERVFAAGPPASILLYMLAPEKMTGWPNPPTAEERPFIAAPYRDLTALGRLTGRGGTANIEVVLKSKPDLILDFGSVRETYVSLADNVQEQTKLPYILIDGRFEATPAALRLPGSILGVDARSERLAAYVEAAFAVR